MSPSVERPVHPHVQIANFYRDQIETGTLVADERLPSFSDIARQFDVAVGTVSKAIGKLQVEGLVTTSRRGTFVSGRRGVDSPRSRHARHGGVGANYPHSERREFVSVTLMTPPDYVAELLDLDDEVDGDQVIRREWVTYRRVERSQREEPWRLSVSWYPGRFATQVPDLLRHGAMHELTGKMTELVIEEATGRAPRHGEDWIEARRADAREAEALRVAVGDPVLAQTFLWTDDEGAVEYREWVDRERHVRHEEYELPNAR